MEAKYYKVPFYVAERLGLQNIRRHVDKAHVILTESDMKMLDVTIDEKVQLFGCEVLTESQANTLIESYIPKEKEVTNE